ncbi:MAG: ABC transporter permease [Acidobacteria bacterium]|nr:ABC transporter permease [Acidobacteriota bacterium]
MRTLATLVLKDVRRRFADPAALLLNLAIPLVMAGMMALAFGGRGDSQRTPVLHLLVVNHDEGPIGRALANAQQNPEAAERLEIRQAKSREEGLRRLREEEAAALILIPKNLSADLFDGRNVELELVKNPAASIMPVIAQQGVEVAALYISIGARLLDGRGPRIAGLFEGKGWDDPQAIALLVTELYGRVRGVDDFLIPPLIEVKTGDKEPGEEADKGRPNFMIWMFPGVMIMGLLFTANTQMRDLLREGETGTLRRQLAAPLGAVRVLIAKIVSVAAVVAIATVLLLLVGRWAFGMRWGPVAPLAAASAAVVLAATGFAALVFSLVRTERQGDAFGGVLIMLMSLLGGTLFPPQIVPDWMEGIARLTLTYWSHGALRDLAAGGGWDKVQGEVSVLLIIGLVLTLAGVMALRHRHLRGAL